MKPFIPPFYIHMRADWPHFRWDLSAFTERLASARYRQGRLLGRMESLGFSGRQGVMLEALTEEVQKSSEIEGEHLNKEQVRSSLARRLGIESVALLPEDRFVEGVVEMAIDASRGYQSPLTAERLFGWHAVLFPTGRSGLQRIRVGDWRDDSAGPMQVISGAVGRERIHFQAPDADRVLEEMSMFLRWFEQPSPLDPIVRAAISHLWFVTVHPFDDGNGRIARAITDMALARSENSPQRFYSMSAQIRRERKEYYDILEQTQKGDLDITPWIDWFLRCLERAVIAAEETMETVFASANFWDRMKDVPLNPRQQTILNLLLEGRENRMTAQRWAKRTHCSHDTALRDINDLIAKGILGKEEAGGRSTRYIMHPSLGLSPAKE